MTDTPLSDSPLNALFDTIYNGDTPAVQTLLTAHPELLTATDPYYHHTPL